MEKIGDNIYNHEGRRYGIKENGDIFQIPHDILPTQGAEEKKHHIDHTHCWNQKSPACGQKIEHLKCCLCEKLNPKAQGAEEKEISLVTGLPVSKTWYALEPKTNRVLDEDSDLKVLHERVKEKGLEVVYSRHRFEIRAEEESPSPSEEWEKEFDREFGMWKSNSNQIRYKNHIFDIKRFISRLLTQQRERRVREVEDLRKPKRYWSWPWWSEEDVAFNQGIDAVLSKLSPGSKQ